MNGPVLAIETSCDETAVAILQPTFGFCRGHRAHFTNCFFVGVFDMLGRCGYGFFHLCHGWFFFRDRFQQHQETKT